MELPKITHSSQISQLLRQVYQRNNKCKSTSVISIQKYLKVKSRNQETLAEEVEDEENTRDHETLTHEIQAIKEKANMSPERQTIKERTSHDRQAVKETNHMPSPRQGSSTDDGIHTKRTRNDGYLLKQDAARLREQDVEFEHRNETESALDQDHLLTLTRGQKERLISNTARTLGVVSHNWGKQRMTTAHSRTAEDQGDSKQDQQVSTSGSSTRQSKSRAEYRNQSESRMGYRNQITTPAPSNKGNVKTDADTNKIEKLKSIYDSSRHHSRSKSKSVHTSQHPSRCASRHTSRPATRMQVYRTHHQQQVKEKQYSKSRPVTRMSCHPNHTNIALSNLESLEESGTYWSELSQEKTKAVKKHGNVTSTATAFGVVDSITEKKLADFVDFQKSLKVRTGWSEDLSRVVLSKKREGARARGKEAFAGTDKIAQEISLAMKLRKPRESLMRKLTGVQGGVSKAVHQS